MIWDIQDYDVDERQYKFYSFPKIQDQHWEILGLEDCSNEYAKRLKGKLILKDDSVSLEIIKSFIKHAIQKIGKIETPRNPKYDTPYGKVQADAVFLYVFYKSNKRKSFNLFPSNQYFVCIVQWYKTSNIPRLKNGGLTSGLWKKFQKEEIKENLFLAWNPNLV